MFLSSPVPAALADPHRTSGAASKSWVPASPIDIRYTTGLSKQ